MEVDLLVIGAQAAGMSAVSRAKRKVKDLNVLVLEKGLHVSVGACGLPYYIGGLVPKGEDLVVYDVAFFREKRGIPILTEHDVRSIDPEAKTVTAWSEGDQQEVVIQYNTLVISTGGQVNRPGIPGEDLPQVFELKTLEDGMRLRAFMDDAKPRQAVIIGAGVIGLEMAEAFRRQGLAVTIIKRPGSILRMLDDEMIALVEEELKEQGVALHQNVDIQKIEGNDGKVVSVICKDQEFPADLVLLATGTSPRSELARAAGLEIGPYGDIVVDDRMLTSDPDIFAAGDCVAQVHRVSKKTVYYPRGTTANKQGRIAGENAVGGDDRFAGILGTMVTKIFNLQVACTGLNEKSAREAGFDVGMVQIAHASHAHSYPHPHPEPITVRLVVEKESGRLLGGQMIGKIGVSKRIDVLACAITNEMTVGQIGDLDLAYSPPFAPVWDPILIAANAALKVV